MRRRLFSRPEEDRKGRAVSLSSARPPTVSNAGEKSEREWGEGADVEVRGQMEHELFFCLDQLVQLCGNMQRSLVRKKND